MGLILSDGSERQYRHRGWLMGSRQRSYNTDEEVLECFFRQFDVRVEVVYGEEPKDAYQELVEDLLAIVGG